MEKIRGPFCFSTVLNGTKTIVNMNIFPKIHVVKGFTTYKIFYVIWYRTNRQKFIFSAANYIFKNIVFPWTKCFFLVKKPKTKTRHIPNSKELFTSLSSCLDPRNIFFNIRNNILCFIFFRTLLDQKRNKNRRISQCTSQNK